MNPTLHDNPDDDIPVGYDQPIDPDELEFVERTDGADVFIRRLPPPPPPPVPQVSKEEARTRYGLHVGFEMPPANPRSPWKTIAICFLIMCGFGGAGFGTGIIRFGQPVDGNRAHPCLRAIEVLTKDDSPTLDYLSPGEIELLKAAAAAERKQMSPAEVEAFEKDAEY